MTRKEIMQAITEFYGDEPPEDDQSLYDALRAMEREGAVILWGTISEGA